MDVMEVALRRGVSNNLCNVSYYEWEPKFIREEVEESQAP
jgi:hypothetical protein